MTIAVGQDRERHLVVGEMIVTSQAETAVIGSGAFRVIHQLVAKDSDRVAHLGLLDRRVLGVLPVRLDRVGPVARGAGAVAAAERFEEAVILPTAWIDPAEAGVTHHRLRAGDDLLRQRRGQRLEDHVDQPRLRLPASHHRRRGQAVRHRPRRRLDPHQIVEPLVNRHVLVDQALQGIGAGRERLSEGRVDRRASLRIRAAQVEANAGPIDLHPRTKSHRPIAEAVAIEGALGEKRAARQLFQLELNATVGVVDQRVDAEVDDVQAQTGDEIAEAASTGDVCRDLGAQVAGRLALAADLGEN
ncbi:MAG TPA: hypothetical protein VNF73_11520, partial [Candidatus Saccharimonadales bacterium]|nr:hypothetical protein [Candidatus Saccharimonadales bacterium]